MSVTSEIESFAAKCLSTEFEMTVKSNTDTFCAITSSSSISSNG